MALLRLRWPLHACKQAKLEVSVAPQPREKRKKKGPKNGKFSNYTDLSQCPCFTFPSDRSVPSFVISLSRPHTFNGNGQAWVRYRLLIWKVYSYTSMRA